MNHKKRYQKKVVNKLEHYLIGVITIVEAEDLSINEQTYLDEIENILTLINDFYFNIPYRLPKKKFNLLFDMLISKCDYILQDKAYLNTLDLFDEIRDTIKSITT